MDTRDFRCLAEGVQRRQRRHHVKQRYTRVRRGSFSAADGLVPKQALWVWHQAADVRRSPSAVGFLRYRRRRRDTRVSRPRTSSVHLLKCAWRRDRARRSFRGQAPDQLLQLASTTRSDWCARRLHSARLLEGHPDLIWTLSFWIAAQGGYSAHFDGTPYSLVHLAEQEFRDYAEQVSTLAGRMGQLKRSPPPSRCSPAISPASCWAARISVHGGLAEF